MNRSHRVSLIAVCAGLLSTPLLSTPDACAQDTPATPATAPAAQTARPGQPRGPRPNPTNIKALPKDITGDQVIKIMHQYEGDLGVECAFCHARNPETGRNDFASDANPVKETARVMIRMTDEINVKYLAQLPARKATGPVTCGTCHRGMSHPEVFVPRPREPGNHSPATPAAPTTP